jgi:LPXTG-motif cell wall-anchored protein
MRRIIPISLILFALAAPAGAAAQGNSGTDAHTENPPAAGGNDDTSTTTTAPTETSTTETAPTTPPATTPTTPTPSGEPTSSATTPTTPSSASSAGASGRLPATGSEQLVLALIGVALLGVGLVMRRRMRLSAPQAEIGPQAYLSALKRASSWDDRRRSDRRLGG